MSVYRLLGFLFPPVVEVLEHLQSILLYDMLDVLDFLLHVLQPIETITVPRANVRDVEREGTSYRTWFARAPWSSGVDSSPGSSRFRLGLAVRRDADASVRTVLSSDLRTARGLRGDRWGRGEGHTDSIATLIGLFAERFGFGEALLERSLVLFQLLVDGIVATKVIERFLPTRRHVFH